MGLTSIVRASLTGFKIPDVWVIDPVAQTSWNRSLIPGVANSGLTNQQLLSLTSANAQFEQVDDPALHDRRASATTMSSIQSLVIPSVT